MAVPRGLSRESLARYSEVHLSESLLPNAARLTHPRHREPPAQQFSLSPATATAIRNKPQLKRRWIILSLTALLMAGNYYCYDNPAALLSMLERQFSGDGTPEGDQFELYYEMMYSVYSLPNIVLPLIGGVLVDRVGVIFALNMFSFLVLLGQLTFASGTSASSLHIMLIGRAIFGLGGESISVAQSSVTAEWFRGKELALASGITLSVSRLGSVVNNSLSPAIARAVSLPAAVWFGALLCLSSFCSSLVLGAVDRRATKQLRTEERRRQVEDSRKAEAMQKYAPPSFRPGAQGSVKSEGALEAGKGGSSSGAPLLTNKGKCAPSVAAGAAGKGADETGGGLASVPFVALCITCVMVYSAVLPFNNIASALLLDRDFFPHGTRWRDANNDTFVYDQSTLEPPGTPCSSDRGKQLPFCIALAHAQQHTAIVMSEPYIISACLSPVLGHMVDRIGRRGWLSLIATTMLTLAHILMGYSKVPASYLLVGLGLGYSCFAAVVWPSVPIVVQRSQVGTAYGLLTALQNCGLFLTPILVSMIFDRTSMINPANPYSGVQTLFACQGALAMLASLMLLCSPSARAALNAKIIHAA